MLGHASVVRVSFLAITTVTRPLSLSFFSYLNVCNSSFVKLQSGSYSAPGSSL